MAVVWRQSTHFVSHSRLEDADGAVSFAEVDLLSQVDEESVLHDSGDHVERRLDLRPVVVLASIELPVKQEVPVVCHDGTRLPLPVTQDRFSSELTVDLLADKVERHGDHFDRDSLLPVLPQTLGPLAVICHDDQLARGGCDDLLLRQAATASLDQHPLLIHLICTVDRHVDRGKLFQIPETQFVEADQVLGLRVTADSHQISEQSSEAQRVTGLNLKGGWDAVDVQAFTLDSLSQSLHCMDDRGSRADSYDLIVLSE